MATVDEKLVFMQNVTEQANQEFFIAVKVARDNLAKAFSSYVEAEQRWIDRPIDRNAFDGSQAAFSALQTARATLRQAVIDGRAVARQTKEAAWTNVIADVPTP